MSNKIVKINFRATVEALEELKEAAKIAGQQVSEFARQAVSNRVKSVKRKARQ